MREDDRAFAERAIRPNWVARTPAGTARTYLVQEAATWPGYRRRHGELYDPQTSLLLANARLALAQALRQSGHRREARAELERAAAIHARHPALGEHLRRPLEQAEAELGVTGAGTNRVTTRE